MSENQITAITNGNQKKLGMGEIPEMPNQEMPKMPNQETPEMPKMPNQEMANQKMPNADVPDNSKEASKYPIDWIYNMVIYFIVPFWFIFVFGVIIMWCLLRFVIFKDYFEQKNNPNSKNFDGKIYYPGTLEYYLYLIGVPIIVSLCISILIYLYLKADIKKIIDDIKYDIKI